MPDGCGANKRINMGNIYNSMQSSNVPKVIIYDDYNSNIRADQDTIGTITSTIGHSALRNGYKIIEVSG